MRNRLYLCKHLFAVTALMIMMTVVFIGCKSGKLMTSQHFNHLPNPESKHYNSVENYDSTQVIFFAVKSNGADSAKFEDDINKFRKQFEKTYKPTLFARCAACNTEILFYSGDSIPTFISGQTASSGGVRNTSGGKITGDDNDILWSANFGIRSNDSIAAIREFPGLNLNPEQIRTIAVLDTGIDTTGISSRYFYQSNNASCLGAGAENGWNFADDSPDWHDDNAEKHGTTVTRFILNEVNTVGRIGAKILPVKTHNAAGESDLYNVLCALSYAADRKVDMINASFGFYTDNIKNPKCGKVDSASILFLTSFVDRYLRSKNIILIAAAGNVTPGHTQRDLGAVSFYPASLSETLSNVISVTTVRKSDATVSPRQNYSNHVVTIGVNADTIAFDNNRAIDYVFYDPLHSGGVVRGSSFATPIATGNICSFFDLYSSNPDNHNIVLQLDSKGIVKRDAPSLGEFIVDNNVLYKQSKQR